MRENTVYELIKEYLCFTFLLTVITQSVEFWLVRVSTAVYIYGLDLRVQFETRNKS